MIRFSEWIKYPKRKKTQTVYQSEYENEHFRQIGAREKLARRLDLKYGDYTTDKRVANRRNITFEMRKYMSVLMGVFLENCPYVTGNGRINGIKYTITNKGSGEIHLGGLLAPYIVHLGLPLTRPNIHDDWIENSITKCNIIIEQEGWPLDFHLSEVGYGWCKFSVMNLGGEEYD